MAGQIVSVCPMRRFDFSGTSLGQTTTLILMQNIDIAEWGTASLLVRVASIDMGGGSVLVTGTPDSMSPDDPRANFVGPPLLSDGEPIGALFDGFAVAPTFACINLSGSLGSGLRVVAQANRTSVSGNLAVTMSIDLCLKNELIIQE
jgi:hypothetical protein